MIFSKFFCQLKCHTEKNNSAKIFTFIFCIIKTTIKYMFEKIVNAASLI